MGKLKYSLVCMLGIIFFVLPLKTSAGINSINRGSQNKQFLVSIARPLNDEYTYRNIFKVCGSAKRENIRVRIFILKGDSYISLRNTRGELYWDIGKSGIFAKEIILPNEGNNRICICSYDKNQENNLTLGENMQINEYNITLLNSDMKISDILDKLF